jgi:hypothetical protein
MSGQVLRSLAVPIIGGSGAVCADIAAKATKLVNVATTMRISVSIVPPEAECTTTIDTT